MSSEFAWRQGRANLRVNGAESLIMYFPLFSFRREPSESCGSVSGKSGTSVNARKG